MDNLFDSLLTKRQVRQRQSDSDSEHLPQCHSDGDMRGKVDKSSCRIWGLFVFMYNDFGYSNSFGT